MAGEQLARSRAHSAVPGCSGQGYKVYSDVYIESRVQSSSPRALCGPRITPTYKSPRTLHPPLPRSAKLSLLWSFWSIAGLHSNSRLGDV